MLTRLATQRTIQNMFWDVFELIDATTGLFSHYEPRSQLSANSHNPKVMDPEYATQPTKLELELPPVCIHCVPPIIKLSGAQEDMSPNTKVITTHRGINKTCPALINPES